MSDKHDCDRFKVGTRDGAILDQKLWGAYASVDLLNSPSERLPLHSKEKNGKQGASPMALINRFDYRLPSCRRWLLAPPFECWRFKFAVLITPISQHSESANLSAAVDDSTVVVHWWRVGARKRQFGWHCCLYSVWWHLYNASASFSRRNRSSSGSSGCSRNLRNRTSSLQAAGWPVLLIHSPTPC